MQQSSEIGKETEKEDPLKKVTVALMCAIACIFFAYLLAEEFTYVGAAKCKICHRTDSQGKQHPIWEESFHSKSFQALDKEEAKAIAADAPDNPECLECHSPLAAKAPELKEEGVNCEVCHGPGSDYKTLSIMKNREESVTKGLVIYKSEKDIKKHCLTCHENPHDIPFDFAAAWEKIKHYRPVEKSSTANSSDLRSRLRDVHGQTSPLASFPSARKDSSGKRRD